MPEWREVAAVLVTIWWRDIPTQVNAQSGRARYRAALPRRFQRAVDEAAMAAGLTQASDYVAEWRRTSEPHTGPTTPAALQAAADATAAGFDADYPKERLVELAGNRGFAP
jgi:Virulence factor